MSTDFVQSNGRIAEVRVVCDQCNKLIGICMMPQTEANAQKSTKVFCHRCKEEK